MYLNYNLIVCNRCKTNCWEVFWRIL